MKWVVLADEPQKDEILSRGIAVGINIEWVSAVKDFSLHPGAEVFVDLLFENTETRISVLKQLLPGQVIINSVINTLEEIGHPFVRINGWSTFLKRETVEASCRNESVKSTAKKNFTLLNRKVEWVPDIPGFISARVVAMIINEAYFALEEGVSTKIEIDTAMRLGTNYPFGPFEWSEKIGLKKIYALLVKLKKTNARYTPAALLQKEVFP